METPNKVLKWGIIIGIIVVLNLFFNYSISLFYKEPEWDSYFRQPQVVEPITKKDECLKVGGQWTEQNYQYYDKTVPVQIDSSGKPIKGYCNPDYTKQQEFTKMQNIYQRNVFIALIILGIISLFIGTFSANIIISLGFSWGGVLSLIIASMRYWTNANNILKVVILAVALMSLIWLAIKKFGKTFS